jgi:catechol 2,3-dioxygenase-like lactoylglutathione lyase family enzyme
MRLINGLHHAALRCCGKAEMDSVIEFYCDVLGMFYDRPFAISPMEEMKLEG